MHSKVLYTVVYKCTYVQYFVIMYSTIHWTVCIHSTFKCTLVLSSTVQFLVQYVYVLFQKIITHKIFIESSELMVKNSLELRSGRICRLVSDLEYWGKTNRWHSYNANALQMIKFLGPNIIPRKSWTSFYVGIDSVGRHYNFSKIGEAKVPRTPRQTPCSNGLGFGFNVSGGAEFITSKSGEAYHFYF